MGAQPCPPLHTLPALYSPVIGARHHVLLIDELDAVNRAPTKQKTKKQTSDHEHTLRFYETDPGTHSPAMSPTTCRLPVMLSTHRGVAGSTSTSPPAPTPDLLMPVEDELRLLWDLPDPHSAIPSPRGHTALPAQAVQPRDDVLVPKAGGEHGEL